MKNPVVIKSNTHGLTLLLDPEIPFEDLVREICRKFAASRDFFGEVELVLSVEGREVTAEETAVIIEAIELNSGITVSLIQEKQTLKDLQMQGKIDKFYFEKLDENAKIIKGSIKNRQRIQSDSGLVILGDVKANAVVEARGNVIVMGLIEGMVHAGYPDGNHCYIVAGGITSDSLAIGTVRGEPTVQKKWFSRMQKSKSEPVAVVVWEGVLLSEPLSSGLIKQR